MMQKSPRELDYIELNVRPKGIVVRRLREEDFEPLYQLAKRHFGNEIASMEVVHRVVDYNPESAYAIGRLDRSFRFRPRGYVALLLLNCAGVAALEAGRLDAGDPDLDFLVPAGGKPVGIYVWGLVATGKAIVGIPQIMEELKREPYSRVDLYARAASAAGLHLMEALNFERCGAAAGEAEDKPLYRYRRLVNRKAA